MTTEESNSAEFKEKTGLKRKLTGPPRLLLGKSRSPGQDEKKSRKHRRHGGDETLVDTAKDEQSAESQVSSSPEHPETVLTTELDGGTCTDLQEGCLETNLEQNMKKRRRRSKAGAAVRQIFSCIRRRKELGVKAVEDTEDNTYHRARNNIRDKELLTHSDDSLKTKKQVKKVSSRKFKVRTWCIFKKCTSTSKQEADDHGQEQCNDTFTEISSETGVGQQISAAAAAEPPAVDEEQNESSRIVEDVTRTSPDPNNEVMEMISLNVATNTDSDAVFVHHQHPPESLFSCLVDEEFQISEASLSELIGSGSDLEDPRTSPEDPVTDDTLVDIPLFKCKPIITIEDVHSSDEEDGEFFETAVQRYGTLSPLVPLNGSCSTLKTPERHFSEILLTQKALSLVQAAISGAVEQLSSELQNRQDQDHI
ncbi:uncharacterized protein si:dkey-1h6.8 [Tachysurus fulvidraco]|uniref:uncharacterized protein si:dkey-1h6.8 n=1 Tax=Tachysurus fulvidraco TaxID=1234273 RepID=UPI000F4FEC51|nr:uncharacterized protein si:dkey-1h6.8 [Tachysurus fulvidraco]